MLIHKDEQEPQSPARHSFPYERSCQICKCYLGEHVLYRNGSVPLLVSTKKVTANWKPWPSKNDSSNESWTTWRYMWRFYSIEPRICLICQRQKMLKKFQKHNYLQRRTLVDLWQGVRHQFHATVTQLWALLEFPQQIYTGFTMIVHVNCEQTSQIMQCHEF
jgi:hypothetical protein